MTNSFIFLPDALAVSSITELFLYQLPIRKVLSSSAEWIVMPQSGYCELRPEVMLNDQDLYLGNIKTGQADNGRVSFRHCKVKGAFASSPVL